MSGNNESNSGNNKPLVLRLALKTGSSVEAEPTSESTQLGNKRARSHGEDTEEEQEESETTHQPLKLRLGRLDQYESTDKTSRKDDSTVQDGEEHNEYEEDGEAFDDEEYGEEDYYDGDEYDDEEAGEYDEDEYGEGYSEGWEDGLDDAAEVADENVPSKNPISLRLNVRAVADATAAEAQEQRAAAASARAARGGAVRRRGGFVRGAMRGRGGPARRSGRSTGNPCGRRRIGGSWKTLTGALRGLVYKYVRSFGIFHDPVVAEEVPDYYEVINKPLFLFTIKKKVVNNEYTDLTGFRDDIIRMCNNAMLYNVRDTLYYREALRLKKLLAVDVTRTRRRLELMDKELKRLQSTGADTSTFVDPPAPEVDAFFADDSMIGHRFASIAPQSRKPPALPKTKPLPPVSSVPLLAQSDTRLQNPPSDERHYETFTVSRPEATMSEACIRRLNVEHIDSDSQLHSRFRAPRFDVFHQYVRRRYVQEESTEKRSSQLVTSSEESPVDSVEESPVDSIEESPVDSIEESPMDSIEESPVDSSDETSALSGGATSSTLDRTDPTPSDTAAATRSSAQNDATIASTTARSDATLEVANASDSTPVTPEAVDSTLDRAMTEQNVATSMSSTRTTPTSSLGHAPLESPTTAMKTNRPTVSAPQAKQPPPQPKYPYLETPTLLNPAPSFEGATTPTLSSSFTTTTTTSSSTTPPLIYAPFGVPAVGHPYTTYDRLVQNYATRVCFQQPEPESVSWAAARSLEEARCNAVLVAGELTRQQRTAQLAAACKWLLDEGKPADRTLGFVAAPQPQQRSEQRPSASTQEQAASAHDAAAPATSNSAVQQLLQRNYRHLHQLQMAQFQRETFFPDQAELLGAAQLVANFGVLTNATRATSATDSVHTANEENRNGNTAVAVSAMDTTSDDSTY
eukprot:CAMPEP_0174232276 /NCGR_PEP_ID=MMETSP0417-20130205/2602_1 /TAXON_ID=242541 /ORGANISM="Mayorella sp, Strain BSH-02190019" /LENGTH=914 /DNA_ID=CAMNT_0015310295 /DNA_START=57 /DNA_END=2801 /DNA_ORIENTATION=-